MKTYRDCPYRSPMAISVAIKDIIEDKVVCDLGCAEGDNMIFMSRFARHVKGLESSDRIKVALERGLDVVRGDYYQIELPNADVYYMWPDNGPIDNVFLVKRIMANPDFKGHIIVVGDYGCPPEPATVSLCAKVWGGELREVEFNEGKGYRQSGKFILAVLKAPSSHVSRPWKWWWQVKRALNDRGFTVRWMR